jgi:putative acyl-CoA dehydrogenase
MLRSPDLGGANGRRIAQAVAVTVQAAQLLQHAPPFVSDAFCSARLVDDALAGAAFGTLADTPEVAAILARALA